MDHVAAYRWYKAVADRGEHRATAALKSLSSLMTDAQIKTGHSRHCKTENLCISSPKETTARIRWEAA
jgi:hypothetical protein